VDLRVALMTTLRLVGTGLLAAGAVVAVVLLVTALAGSGGQDREAAAGNPTLEAGGAGVRMLPSPIPRAPGKANLPALARENRMRYYAMLDAQGPQELADGTINGIPIVTADDTPRKFPCEDAEASVESVTPEEMPFRIDYLPAGSFEDTEPFLRVCPDGSIYVALRAFRLYPEGVPAGPYGSISVRILGGEVGLPHDIFGPHRVKPGTVRGVPAIFIEPWTPEGSGESVVAWPVKGGILEVYAIDVPFEEVLKVAEGVSCIDC
jgi:hypothetical protein